MSIIRSKRKNNFTVISNSVFTSGLSWRAIGMLTYLLSKPDDWEVSVANLVNHTKNTAKPLGRDGVYSVLKELESKGFLGRSQEKSEVGTFNNVKYVVYDDPLPAKPYPAHPYPANPTQLNTDHKQKTDSNQKELLSSSIEPDDSPKKSDVLDIFHYWCGTMGKGTATKLTAKRRKNIRDRLKEGYTVQNILAAIDGCTRSKFHMGVNNHGKVYNDIELICRSGEKLEQFMDMVSVPDHGGSANTRATVNNLADLELD